MEIPTPPFALGLDLQYMGFVHFNVQNGSSNNFLVQRFEKAVNKEVAVFVDDNRGMDVGIRCLF